MGQRLTVLVTGGSGFLGHAIVAELRDEARRRGTDLHVRVFDRAPSSHADELVRGDVTAAAAVRAACAGADVVIHSAAMIDWGNAPEEAIAAVNLEGTRNVLAACAAEGVRGVVHTSTIDAVFGGEPLVDADESTPYPARWLDAYGRFKAAAEREVVAADGRPGPLRTAVLRPAGIYGERDPYHLGNVLREAREGRLVCRIGDGRALFEHVYVGNVGYAHALAAFEMAEPAPRIAGRCYFVTDQPAQNFFDFMAPFVTALGHRMPSRRLPARAALAAALVVEGGTRLLSPIVRLRPSLTRSAVTILTTSQSFDGSRLRADLGYAPRYSTDEAFARTVAWFRENPTFASP